MKRNEILTRIKNGEVVFAEQGVSTAWETSFAIGPERHLAIPIRLDQFAYLGDHGLISEAKREKKQPWYQTRWKGT